MTTKQPAPEGMGDEVILFTPETLRDIAKLPADVEIVGTVGPPPDKYHDWTPNPYLYIHVRHKLAIRCPWSQSMHWTTIDEFCTRIESLREQYEL